MISKEKFKEYMEAIKATEEKDLKVDSFIRTLNSGGEGIAMIYSDEETVMIKMLCDCMDIEYNENCDYGDDIQYFIYELDWGKKWTPGCITEADGTEIDFSTVDKLYDYLAKQNCAKSAIGD